MKTCIACGMPMTDFLVRTQGLDKEVARQTAVRTLAKLPAWREIAQ
ncbi:hypothetical protein [Desulfitobacterium hafniense]|uniref:Uncharacterized protein n=3 Tax=Desulfitobacterium hafniense TaxID=49338 RepID=Q24TR3_DESHY|nr:hypothetical protein [Desulfitobacterium hafniense]BAE84579.1 hypothetical protein DSY2790 [Desulfitobacterium hafniense Y51]CDX02895.1 Hypothetical protein DPCES_3008 [Desulfitobacterium hafniense]